MEENQIITIMNTIRDNSSQEYQDRIPEATKNNINEIGGIMLSDINLANQFTSALMNKVAKTVFIGRSFKNPLAILKKGNKPIGDTIEEILVNFAKSKQYNPAGTELMQVNKPDVKTVYHQMNRQNKYPVTINRVLLSKAFKSVDSLGRFFTNIFNSLYNGSNLDEFLLIKQMFAQAVADGTMKKYHVADPCLSEANAKEFIKTVKIISGDMNYPNTNYNGYLQAQSVDLVPITTFTPTEDQIIVISNSTNVSLDVDVLAKAFNMNKMDFLARTIVIDSFPNENIRACIVDVDWSQIYDDYVQVTEFFNADGLYTNYFLHVGQTIDYSCLVNAVALVVGSDEDDDNDIETYDITYTLGENVTSTNKNTTIDEGGRFVTTLKNVTDETVTVTSNSVNVTSTAYNSSTGKIIIDPVVGDIVITVA